MADRSLGRTGTVVLIIAIVLLMGEDLLILYKTGAFPAIEFLLFDVLIIGILALIISEVRRRRPP